MVLSLTELCLNAIVFHKIFYENHILSNDLLNMIKKYKIKYECSNVVSIMLKKK